MIAPSTEVEPLTATEGTREIAVLWMLAALAASVSVTVQGFGFGYSNNVFHIPIVLGLPAIAQFRDDAFYQSLGNFVSVVFPLLRVVATERNIAALFLGAHVIARTIAIFALLRMIALTARTPIVLTVLFAGALAISPLLDGVSPIGGHDLFLGYFTHSELATAVALTAVVSAARGRFGVAALIGGVAFDINAFVGVWTAAALAAAVLATVPRADWKREATRRIAVSACVFAACASPVVWWMLRGDALTSPAGVTFDFRSYLSAYYGLHTFIVGRTATTYLAAMQLLAVGTVSLIATPRLRAVAAAYAAYAAIFAFGAVLPFITASRLLLNLFPLRADGLLVLLGIGALLPAVVTLAGDDSDDSANHPLVMVMVIALVTASIAVAATTLATLLARRGFHRLAIALCLTVFLPALVLPAPLVEDRTTMHALFVAAIAAGTWSYGMLRGSRDVCTIAGILLAGLIGGRVGWIVTASLLPLVVRREDQSIHLLPVAIGATIAVALLLSSGRTVQAIVALAALSAAFVMPATRARSGTGQRSSGGSLILAGVLLLALTRSLRLRSGNDDSAAPPPQFAIAAWARAQTSSESRFLVPLDWDQFQWRSRRRVWVDTKQGAAVMWKPSFYRQWYPRWRDVGQLKSTTDLVAYACANTIDFVVVSDTTALSPAIRMSSGQWSVVDAARACNTHASGAPGQADAERRLFSGPHG